MLLLLMYLLTKILCFCSWQKDKPEVPEKGTVRGRFLRGTESFIEFMIFIYIIYLFISFIYLFSWVFSEKFWVCHPSGMRAWMDLRLWKLVQRSPPQMGLKLSNSKAITLNQSLIHNLSYWDLHKYRHPGISGFHDKPWRNYRTSTRKT